MISNVVYRAYIALILLDRAGILAKDLHGNSFTKVLRSKGSQLL